MFCNILEILERSAVKNPEGIAFRQEGKKVTYRECVETARRLGIFIAEKVQTTNQPIAVTIGRDIESVLLFLAVTYSGNFYVPIDLDMPAERVNMILQDLKPLLFLGQEEGQWVSVERNIEEERWEKRPLEINQKAPEEGAVLTSIREAAIDTDPLYAIYTSGSTGRPKGVVVSHRSVIDLVEQFALTFPFLEHTVIGNQAPFDFDVSVKDIYNAIYQAGTMVVIPKQCFLLPLKLIEYLNEYKINTIIWAVSAMRIVENFKTFSKAVPEHLKLVMFSGEIMPVRVLQYWQQAVPEAVYVNLYGPTEITCNCTYYVVDREFKPEESLPIGKPFRNTRILMLPLEENGEKKLGEICVTGTCLALGYYGDRKRTAEAFVQNPLQEAYPERMYRTGDLGYYNEEGLLMFASRKDYQIKHMGHRIELGEIESHVNAISYLDAAVCVFDEKREKLVLFYQCNQEGRERFSDQRQMERDIVAQLGKKLPKFMWPNRYVQYDELPLNKNGKIDRVVLKAALEE